MLSGLIKGFFMALIAGGVALIINLINAKRASSNSHRETNETLHSELDSSSHSADYTSELSKLNRIEEDNDIDNDDGIIDDFAEQMIPPNNSLSKSDNKPIFCHRCGSRLKDDSVFCSYCGQKVEQDCH